MTRTLRCLALSLACGPTLVLAPRLSVATPGAARRTNRHSSGQIAGGVVVEEPPRQDRLTRAAAVRGEARPLPSLGKRDAVPAERPLHRRPAESEALVVQQIGDRIPDTKDQDPDQEAVDDGPVGISILQIPHVKRAEDSRRRPRR